MIIAYSLIAVLLIVGCVMILFGFLFHDKTFLGRKKLILQNKWAHGKQDMWDIAFLKTLISHVSQYVFLDKHTENTLTNDLYRANLNITAKEFTARKYIIIGFAVALSLFSALFHFWFGIIAVVLLTVFLLMNEKETLASRIKERDEAIALEMPRFVRTICRNLRSTRDIFAILESYNKVAGPYLGKELTSLLVHMQTGSTDAALQQFQTRIGTEEAFRLCSTLIEIDRGIDQLSTLEYLADDMAHQAKLNIQKILATRPGQMRFTYVPAVLVCIAMIFYMLIVFVSDLLANLL